jgi:hypothetical protein
VETLAGNPVSTAQKSQTVVFKASVVDLNNGTSVSSATVTALLIYPNSTESTLPLSPDNANVYGANATLDSNLVGEYSVIFTAEYSGATIKKQYRFNVRSEQLFMDAFSPEKGEGEGFPPSSTGMLIIGGQDLSTDAFLNLTTLTDNCNSSKIRLVSILDDKKTNFLTAFTVMNLTQLFEEANAPEWIRTEMQNTYGERACAIRFTTPSASGTYKLEVQANISGTTNTVKDYLDITSLFVYGIPAHCTTGAWSSRVSPGGTACIRLSVFDASNGVQIAKENITDISLIEVFSQSRGIITDQISGVTRVNFTNGYTGISFRTSNTSLGDHSLNLRLKL